MADRYYSNTIRVVSLLCAIFISFTYVAGQMRGVGVVFSRFMASPSTWASSSAWRWSSSMPPSAA